VTLPYFALYLRFCCHFDQFRELRIWKMQLVDETHLLIKYGTEHMVTQRALEPNSQPAFFVLYNIVSAEVSSSLQTV